MTGTPKLSVVIPAYQQGRFLGETIRSVLQQKDAALELIVSDHSSTDDTLDIAERFRSDPRVRIMTTPAGGGAAANWAAVTRAARGEYIKLLPGDDTVTDGSLARQVALLDDNPDAVLVGGARRIVGATGKTIAPRRGLQGLSAHMSGEAAVRQSVLSGTNPFGEPGAVMMRRAALEAAGGWQGEWSYAIDLATYYAVLRHGDFVRDDAVAATFRVSAGQWSVALVEKQAREIRALFDLAAVTFDGITPADASRGAKKAQRMARLRRLIYTLMPGGRTR
ncbi:glycosyltransferase family 2 protein [Microbacterium amylolyticum]|uniref:Glycosyltransferase involved in cell wall biosynthesis n=1 Tax=Microbacterium amylolyticum TaxID=936337 RepID=A0ABS4ZIH1_9MICO|nr:glycosyltransferase family 2 protein [Microbacterium amylolyticum]MBP2437084.1 glycosyltransferase involved in cell wall biosynthesis [Microbacterium amylolyticum]